jgi:nucleolar protein 58
MMRLKEWYGWHFPEMAKIIADGVVYAKIVKTSGIRSKLIVTDFSDLLPSEMEKELKDVA